MSSDKQIGTPTTWQTARQAAEALGLKINTLQAYILRGKFPHAQKIGSIYFIPPEDIADFRAAKAARIAHKEQRLYKRMSKAAKAEYDARKAKEAQTAETGGENQGNSGIS